MKKKSFKKGMAFMLAAVLTCGVVYASPVNLLDVNATEGDLQEQGEDLGNKDNVVKLASYKSCTYEQGYTEVEYDYLNPGDELVSPFIVWHLEDNYSGVILDPDGEQVNYTVSTSDNNAVKFPATKAGTYYDTSTQTTCVVTLIHLNSEPGYETEEEKASSKWTEVTLYDDSMAMDNPASTVAYVTWVNKYGNAEDIGAGGSFMLGFKLTGSSISAPNTYASYVKFESEGSELGRTLASSWYCGTDDTYWMSSDKTEQCQGKEVTATYYPKDSVTLWLDENGEIQNNIARDNENCGEIKLTTSGGLDAELDYKDLVKLISENNDAFDGNSFGIGMYWQGYDLIFELIANENASPDSLAADKVKSVVETLGGYSVGQYMDFLLDRTSSEVVTPTWTITNHAGYLDTLPGTATMTVSLPDEMINTDESKSRIYKIVQLYTDSESGEISSKVLDATFDKDTQKLSFEVDKLTDTEYVVLYGDAASADDLKIDYENGKITGLDPSSTYIINGETVTPSKDGTLDIDKDWYGTDLTIVKKGTGNEVDLTETITVQAKAAAPTTVGFVNESKAGAGDGKITGVSTDMEYKVNGAAIWTPCTGDTVTGLTPGKYEVRVKSINGKLASDPVSGDIGTTVSDDTTGGAGNSGSGSTDPVNPDPVTPVNPDPVTPVNPDPVTPLNPDQGGTDQGNGGNGGNGGSSTSTSGSYSSDSDDDDDDSYSTNNNRRPGSQSGSSTTNGTTNGTAANAGDQNTAGTNANNQTNSSASGTTANITNGSGISQNVKDNLNNALESILKIDSNVQTGPYVRSDSDSIAVEIPSDLQKSDRNFYLMTAKDNGDIVILPNESTEENMFEANGEADTDYQMIFEDGDTPLASMITESGVLDTSAAAGCINHGVGLGLALLGLLAAALLARMGKKYFWAASAAGLALALVASATGSCSLDWIYFAGEAIVTIAVTAALMLKKPSAKEQ